MKSLKIIAGILIAFSLIAIVSEMFGYSLLIYYGKAIGGYIGLALIFLGVILITVVTEADKFKEAGRNPIKWYVTFVDGLNENLGLGASWFTSVMVIVVFTNVVMRYIFGGGKIDFENASTMGTIFLSIISVIRTGLTFILETVRLPVPTGASLALQDMSWYVFGVIFLIGAAYTLKHDRHVRVDIFYVNYSIKTKIWTNLLGSIFFLIPFCILGIWVSWGFVTRSYVVQEVSPNEGGLGAIYLVKSILPLGFFLILLQGISLICRSFLQLTGKIPMPSDPDSQVAGPLFVEGFEPELSPQSSGGKP